MLCPMSDKAIPASQQLLAFQGESERIFGSQTVTFHIITTLNNFNRPSLLCLPIAFGLMNHGIVSVPVSESQRLSPVPESKMLSESGGHKIQLVENYTMSLHVLLGLLSDAWSLRHPPAGDVDVTSLYAKGVTESSRVYLAPAHISFLRVSTCVYGVSSTHASKASYCWKSRTSARHAHMTLLMRAWAELAHQPWKLTIP